MKGARERLVAQLEEDLNGSDGKKPLKEQLERFEKNSTSDVYIKQEDDLKALKAKLKALKANKRTKKILKALKKTKA